MLGKNKSKVAAALILIIVLMGTSPDRLSAPALMGAILIVGLTLWLFIKSIIMWLQNKLSPEKVQVQDDGSLSRVIIVGSLILVFLFALNLTGALSLRDVILACVLGLTLNFYVERRIKSSQ